MRWVSFVTIISVALAPAVSARPRCRPDKQTTTSDAASLSDTATVTSLDTSTATATSLDIPVTRETTTDSFTTLETTTIAVLETSTDLDSAAITETSTAEATTTEVTTTAAATTTQAAGPTIYVKNGEFEDQPNTGWTVQDAQIKTDVSKASSGSRYVQFDAVNEFVTGSKQISQNIKSLSTERLYRLDVASVVFSEPAVVREPSTICVIQPNFGTRSLAQWRLDFDNLDQYKANFVNFTPDTEDGILLLRLRCSDGKVVSISAGVDDVSIVDIGPKLVG
ncbi:unnamed protein product [Fusarium graminearum]|nr:hypothetical protein FG05_11675 [Fusarium graminearum]PCD30183.1 hypothetical protein FGRA07_10333 [Fusarium graminearum]CAF3498542.1 unnamed protein product [Fusarium graminearum]CAG1990696.1 unnamed protein product [Fusarium graminearum]CAG2001457.1 unnamed protein product [Fusarium graminearum]